MYFIITAIDRENSLEIRMDTRPTHLDYLQQQDCLRLAGPLLTEDNKPRGSMLIIEVADRAAAEKFARNDPYALGGLFSSVEISLWLPTVGPWAPAEGG